MHIRISVILLGLLGVAAALGAAMLTASLQAQPLKTARQLMATPEKRIMVAAKDLMPLTVLDPSCLEERMVPGDQVPQDAVADASLVTGKLLTVPVVAGQALTKNLFAAEGSGLHLAGLLEPGKRAVTVALSDYSGLEGLVYPGCRVDVMGTFPLGGSSKIGSAVSTCLLENVPVLAVGHQAVGAPDEALKGSSKDESKSFNKKLLVTLMVEANQAEAVQLGMEHGQIALALRNPHDELEGDKDATLLSEGRLAQLAKMLDPTVGAEKSQPKTSEIFLGDATPAQPASVPPPPRSPQKRSEPEVKINVIRGVATETVSFPYPKSMR